MCHPSQIMLPIAYICFVTNYKLYYCIGYVTNSMQLCKSTRYFSARCTCDVQFGVNISSWETLREAAACSKPVVGDRGTSEWCLTSCSLLPSIITIHPGLETRSKHISVPCLRYYFPLPSLETSCFSFVYPQYILSVRRQKPCHSSHNFVRTLFQSRSHFSWRYAFSFSPIACSVIVSRAIPCSVSQFFSIRSRLAGWRSVSNFSEAFYSRLHAKRDTSDRDLIACVGNR